MSVPIVTAPRGLPVAVLPVHPKASSAVTPSTPATFDDSQIPSAAQSAVGAYRVTLAWAVAILMLVLITRSRIGYAVVYYSLVALILFMFATQYQFFAWALEPLTARGSRPFPSKPEDTGGNIG